MGMQTRERLIQETEGLSEPLLQEVLIFLQSLKIQSPDSTTITNETQLLERIDYLETLLGIQKGLESFDRGEGIPAAIALDSLRQKLNIPHKT